MVAAADTPTAIGAQGSAAVAICADGTDESLHARAADLAQALNLPLVALDAGVPPQGFDLLLTVTSRRLELRTVQRGGPGPVYVDFAGGAIGYSRRVGGSRLLLRAVGVQGARPSVVDATAGLGQDAFVLAWAGCRVTAIERSPVAAALLQDGLQRALRVPEVAAGLEDRLSVVVGDARQILTGLAGGLAAPDVVYLDPMYPERRKAALGRKELSVLRRVVGDDDDAAELLDVARNAAQRHVVVKRMRLAPELALHPTRVYVGKTTRYDVYAASG